MEKIQLKYCPRCSLAFECRAEEVTECFCHKLMLTARQQATIAAHYTGCLCLNCLSALQSKAEGKPESNPPKEGSA